MDIRKDATFVKAFQNGDAEALNGLVKRWHKEFCKKAFWLVKDADLAKDIAQDSWTTIIEKIGELRDAERFGRWALRIVYSKSLDALRATTRERDRKKTFRAEQTITTEEPKDNSDIERLLLLKIRTLPEHQQTVIKLFYTESYSLKEISTLLNISVGTAKSRLFHAREHLKQILKHKHDET